jgi:hypothetical protein
VPLAVRHCMVRALISCFDSACSDSGWLLYCQCITSTCIILVQHSLDVRPPDPPISMLYQLTGGSWLAVNILPVNIEIGGKGGAYSKDFLHHGHVLGSLVSQFTGNIKAINRLAVQLLGSSLVASCLSRAFVYMTQSSALLF